MKAELIDLIRQHYPKHTVDLEDIFLIEDENFPNAIMLIGNGGRRVIYQIEGDNVIMYKQADTKLPESDVAKWKSIIRESKLLKLGV